MDNNIQDPDDPAAIFEVNEELEQALLIENFGPEQLPLEDVLEEEVVNQRYQLNRGGLINEAKVDPEYNLLPAPVTNIEDLWSKKRSIKRFSY